MDREQAQMLAALEEMQMRDSLRTFNGLVERCFTDCVTGFRAKTLTDGEDKCVKACAEKFFNHAVRAAARAPPPRALAPRRRRARGTTRAHSEIAPARLAPVLSSRARVVVVPRSGESGSALASSRKSSRRS
jgi:import inner membrane translocase subunit TIM9